MTRLWNLGVRAKSPRRLRANHETQQPRMDLQTERRKRGPKGAAALQRSLQSPLNSLSWIATKMIPLQRYTQLQRNVSKRTHLIIQAAHYTCDALSCDPSSPLKISGRLQRWHGFVAGLSVANRKTNMPANASMSENSFFKHRLLKSKSASGTSLQAQSA